MNHERCRHQPNKYIKYYGEMLGSLAINAVKVVAHEINPPKPEAPVLNRSELVILDQETAIIREIE